MSIIKRLMTLILIFVCSTVYAESFVIHKISVSGLRRVSLGTVLSYLPVKEGDRIESNQTSTIIQALYRTGFFTDVQLSRNNGDLLITVIERSVIGSIKVNGNKKINNKQMQTVLQTFGVIQGQVLDKAALQRLEQGLIREYYNLGYYNVKITSQIIAQPRNRVDVTINIQEGSPTKIKAITIIGNRSFSQNELLRNFSLSKSTLLTIFTSADQYSREKLDADQEKLRSFYQDHGYLHFNINSTQVSISPDRKYIYITINITEGPVYTLQGYRVSGELLGKRDQLLKIISEKLAIGQTFSRKNILELNSKISNFLGNYGYGSPNIQPIPTYDEQHHQVFVDFSIHPGKRIYVRRISFEGNNKTNDEVLRRQLIQSEGEMFSIANIDESKRRLSNLGYLTDVDTKVIPVPNHPNQVDLLYTVKEVSSISANFQGGYSDAEGFLYGISLSDQNFLGTGKGVSIGFNNSELTKNYSASYFDPYFTTSGISANYSAYYQNNNPGSRSLSEYSTNTYGFSATYGIPFTEHSGFNFGLGFDHIEIGTVLFTAPEVYKFLNQYGSTFNEINMSLGWSYTNLDRAIFPTKGLAQSILLSATAPFDSHTLKYYNLNYTISYYEPIFKGIIFHAYGRAGYGNGYGNTPDYPFFRNYFAGGIDSVRGFEQGSLGPRDFYNNPIGGNVITTATASIIFPNPLGDTVRTSVFTDAGNVFKNSYDFNEIRSSVGAQVEWRTPLAPITFSIATPIASKSSDYLNAFQFNIGVSI